MYRIICVQKQSSRGVLQERCSANMKQTHREQPLKNESCFETLLKSHPCTDVSRKFAAHPQNNIVQENTPEELLLYVKRVLKDYNYKRLLITFVKRNSLTLKNK